MALYGAVVGSVLLSGCSAFVAEQRPHWEDVWTIPETSQCEPFGSEKLVRGFSGPYDEYWINASAAFSAGQVSLQIGLKNGSKPLVVDRTTPFEQSWKSGKSVDKEFKVFMFCDLIAKQSLRWNMTVDGLTRSMESLRNLD